MDEGHLLQVGLGWRGRWGMALLMFLIFFLGLVGQLKHILLMVIAEVGERDLDFCLTLPPSKSQDETHGQEV